MTYVLKIKFDSTADTIKATLDSIRPDETAIEIINPIVRTLVPLLKTALNLLPPHITTLNLRPIFLNGNSFDDLYRLVPPSISHLILRTCFYSKANEEIERLLKTIPESVKELTLSHSDVCRFTSEQQMAIAGSLSHVLKINIVESDGQPVKPTRSCCATAISVTPKIFENNIGSFLVGASKYLGELQNNTDSYVFPKVLVVEILSFLTTQPNAVIDLAKDQHQTQLKEQREERLSNACRFFSKSLLAAAAIGTVALATSLSM